MSRIKLSTEEQNCIELYQHGRMLEAELCCRRLLETNPGSAAGWHLLGMIADAAGKADDAISLISHAILLSPAHPEFHNNIGAIFEQQGDFLKAVESLRHAIRLQPDYVNAHNNLGEVMKDLGRGIESLSCYRTALRYDPNFASASSNLLMGLNYDPDITQETIPRASELGGTDRSERNTLAPGSARINL